MVDRKRMETPEYLEMQRLIGAAFNAALNVFGCTRCAEMHVGRMTWLQASAVNFDLEGNVLPRSDGAMYECAVCLAEAAMPDPSKFDDLIPF